MVKKLRLTDPDINVKRRVRIWTRSVTDQCSLNIMCGHHQQTVTVVSPVHQAFIVDVDEQHPRVEISCQHGQASVGIVENNYSWKINPELSAWQSQIEQFEQDEFALNKCPPQLISKLKTTALFVSSGENEFAVSSNIKNRVWLNKVLVSSNEDWYFLAPDDKLSLELALSNPAITVPLCEYDIGSDIHTAPIEILESQQNIDPGFFDTLDNRFFEFVDKKLTNPWITWQNCNFENLQLSHDEKFNIQKLLIDHKHHIHEKHVIDFGCHKGVYLWPCIQLGCASITGAQPLPSYNAVINEAINNLGHSHKAQANTVDLYDLDSTRHVLKGKNTILLLGVLYHLNHHYQLLKLFTDTSATAMIMSISVFDIEHYVDSRPLLRWVMEKQGIDQNGWEFDAVDPTLTWVGYPNAAWLVRTLTALGWKIESNLLSTRLNTRKIPALRYRAMLTVVR